MANLESTKDANAEPANVPATLTIFGSRGDELACAKFPHRNLTQPWENAGLLAANQPIRATQQPRTVRINKLV